MLLELAPFQPRLAEAAERLWDLLGIFRRHYLDPAFGGSNSLKNVLPVLLPGMSYATLEIRDGEEAQIGWEHLIELPPGGEKRRLEQGLRAYCRQDTLAMVEIYRLLRRGAETNAMRAEA